MQKLKDLITMSLDAKLSDGREPTEQEVIDGVIEAIDVIASIADSLKRIADAQTKLGDCTEGLMSGGRRLNTNR